MIVHKNKLLLSAVLLAGLCLGSYAARRSAIVLPVFAGKPVSAVSTVIIDAGHGGEDGGAVSPDGVKESTLNLQIASKVRDLLQFCGQHTEMTRSEDISLDQGEATTRKRKVSDLRARTEIVNKTAGAVLVSIHQNSLPSSPVTHGAQVFWNSQAGAQELADQMQNTLNQTINPKRPKQSRQIPSFVYMMKHSTAPSVLIECGFLSNPDETRQLQTNTHQLKLASSIAAGFLRWEAGEEIA